MKKFLSLVLALAMTMSLVTISAGAKDFTDADDITYVEAVEVMSAIGVIDGDAAGNVNPTAGLTRGAAAKIICNLILGPTTASALNADAAPYKDVPANSTFAGYIAYCQQQGIISGYADGTFKPAAPLTGYAFMKMLLGALGYDASVEGYTGSNWSIAVAKRALNIGLDDGLVNDFNGSSYVTREEAMLYAFNTLQAVMVEYENSSTIVVGDITVTSTSTATEVKENGNVVTFMSKYFKNLKASQTTVDEFGRPATTWYVKNTKVGTYAETPDLVYTENTDGKVIWADLGEPTITDSTMFSNTLNGGVGSYTYSNIAKNQTAEGSSAVGTVTEVYWDADYDTNNADGKLTIVSYNYWLVKAVEDYDAEDEEVDVTIQSSVSLADDTLSADDFAVENVKEDDYLVITGVLDVSNSIVVKTVAPADVAENVVVSKARTQDYVVAGGETYKYSVEAYTNSTLGKDFMTGSDKYDINGDGYNLYLDPNGYVLGVDGYDAGDSLDKYVFVKDTKQSGFDYIAKVVFMDGTSKTVTVDEVGGNDVDDDCINTAKNNFCTFETDKDGNYELTVVTTYSTTATIESGAKPISTSSRPGTSATVFIAKDKAYTGTKNAPSVASSTVYFMLNDNGALKAVYTGTSGYATNSADEYVYILDATYALMKDGDDEYYVYDVILNGEKTTLDTNESSVTVGLFKIDSYTDGRADLSDEITAADGDLVLVAEATPAQGVSYEDGVLTLKNGDYPDQVSYVLADDVTIITVDHDTVKTIGASSIENQYGKCFNSLYLIKTSSSNDDICTVYMVK